MILQHWFTRTGDVTRYYIVRIYGDGSGWDVFAPVTEDPSITATLSAIK